MCSVLARVVQLPKENVFNYQKLHRVDIFFLALRRSALCFGLTVFYKVRDPGFFHLAAPTSSRSSAIQMGKEMQDDSFKVLRARPGRGMCHLHIHSVSRPFLAAREAEDFNQPVCLD